MIKSNWHLLLSGFLVSPGGNHLLALQARVFNVTELALTTLTPQQRFDKVFWSEATLWIEMTVCPLPTVYFLTNFYICFIFLPFMRIFCPLVCKSGHKRQKCLYIEMSIYGLRMNIEVYSPHLWAEHPIFLFWWPLSITIICSIIYYVHCQIMIVLFLF